MINIKLSKQFNSFSACEPANSLSSTFPCKKFLKVAEHFIFIVSYHTFVQVDRDVSQPQYYTLAKYALYM